MSNVLVFCEAAGDTVKAGSLAAIQAGRDLAQHTGGEVFGLLVGANNGAAAQDAARFFGKVFQVESAVLEHYLAETYAPVVVKAMEAAGAGTVVGTATNLGKDLFPRVTALVDGAMASDVAAIKGAKRFVRPTNAGNALSEVEVLADKVVVTVRQTEFDAAAAAASAGAVEALAVDGLNAFGAKFVELQATVSDRPDLGDAKVVVSGGRGMKNGENFKHLEKLTDLLGGALGASRAACDAGFVPNDLQVGQTGRVVAPDLYIAVGISGAIQHLAGMKGSKVIVAINKNGEEPIFQVADYGLVSTWEEALPPLIAAVEKIKAG